MFFQSAKTSIFSAVIKSFKLTRNNVTLIETKEGKSIEYKYFSGGETISIGRAPNCSIVVQGDQFSRVHTSIIFDKQKEVYLLIDGDGVKKSVNSTWLLVEKETSVEHNDLFNVEGVTFKADFVKNE